MENILDAIRSGSMTAATSKMEGLMIIVNGWKLLNIIKKHPILDVAAVLGPPLAICKNKEDLESQPFNA